MYRNQPHRTYLERVLSQLLQEGKLIKRRSGKSVFYRIFNNAIDHSKSGTAHLKAWLEDDHIKFTIRDFQIAHPDIQLLAINTNETIQLLINRAQADRTSRQE